LPSFANSWFDHLPITAAPFPGGAVIALTQTQSDLWRQKKKEIVLGCHHASSTTVLFKVAFQIWKVGRRSACQQLVPCRSSTQIRCSQIPDRYWDVFMYWDADIGLNFRDLEAGIPDWDCDLHFEILLLFGGKDSGMEIWNLDPPYLLSCAYHCRDMHRFSHCLLWTCCIALRAKVHEGAPYSPWLFLRINMAHHESRIGTGKCEPQSHG